MTCYIFFSLSVFHYIFPLEFFFAGFFFYVFVGFFYILHWFPYFFQLPAFVLLGFVEFIVFDLLNCSYISIVLNAFSEISSEPHLLKDNTVGASNSICSLFH